MTFKELQNELINAKKSKDKIRNNVLTSLIAQIKSSAIDKGCRDNIDENFVDTEILRAKKIINEMINTCPSDRKDVLDIYMKQLDIINEFAPELISNEEEIKGIILDLVNNEYGFTKANKGKIMKIIVPFLKGKADMGIVNKVINQMIE